MAISAQDWALKPSPNKWSKKEILGHLVDSARNNLQRFTEIQYFEPPYKVTPYRQDDQVTANDYQEASLESIKEMWVSLNHHIAYLMQRQSPQRLELTVVLPDGTSTNLQWLMEDYIEHLQHHLDQIFD